MRPPACRPAIPATSRVRSAKSASVSVNCPSGSPARESNPAEMSTSPGRNASAAGTSFFSKAAKIAARPEPAGSGQFSVVPFPPPSPVSSALPVPGYHGD